MSTPSRVPLAIAHDYLTVRGGAERVVLAMHRAFPQAPIYTTLYHPEGTFPEFVDADVRVSPLNHVGPLRRNHRAALPLLAPMSEIAGRLAAQVGADCLLRPHGGSGVLLGGAAGVRRGDVVVLGGGTAGLAAARVSAGMGADVTVFDVDPARMRHIEEITGGAVGAEVGGGVVASADCGASCGAFCATPERSDWARSRSVAGVRTIHVDQTAPTRKTTAAKISVGLVGSMVRPCCADFCSAPSPGCPGHWGATGATGCWACSWAR